MNFQLKQLIALQEIDRAIADLDKGIARIPGQIESSRSDMEKKKKQFVDAKEAIGELQKDRKQLEMDVQSEIDHMAKAKMKLPAVKTNREYTAILTEVDGIKEKISSVEDRELEIMETLEGKEKTLPALEKQAREEEEIFNQYKSKKEAESARMKQEREEVSGRREGVFKTLETKWAKHYDNVARRGDGEVVVPLHRNVCQGCFQQVLPQMAIDVKIGEEIQRCESCIRILFWIEESETQTAVPK